eukprot:4246168-Amphidinium_carterae.1
MIRGFIAIGFENSSLPDSPSANCTIYLGELVIFSKSGSVLISTSVCLMFRLLEDTSPRIDTAVLNSALGPDVLPLSNHLLELWDLLVKISLHDNKVPAIES